MKLRRLLRLFTATLILLILTCCAATEVFPLAAGEQQIVLHSWKGNFPPEMLDAFEAEFGVKVKNVEFSSGEESAAHLFAGNAYDVHNLDNRYVPQAIESALLAPIDLHKIDNFKNVTPSFRNLAFDPGNKYSIPLTWGITGLVMTPRVDQSPRVEWRDLWDESFCGHVVMWKYQGREIVSLTLKSLGYSANSEDAQELAEARRRLLELRPCVILVEATEPEKAVAAIRASELLAGAANSSEARKVTALGLPVTFYLPSDGALIWGDSLVIPAAGKNKQMAETFINFVLRPENSAALINRNYYRIANDAADALVDPELRSDADFFPPTELLREAELLLPLSAEGQRQHEAIWEEFLQDPGVS